MKTLKLITFIIIATFFIGAVYIWIEEGGVASGSIGAYVMVVIFAVMLVSGILTLIILVKAPRLYLYVFLGMIGAVLIFMLVRKTIGEYDTYNARKIWVSEDRANKVFNEAWSMIDSLSKVDLLLRSVNNDTEQKSKKKAAIYLALSFKDKSYETSFLYTMQTFKSSECSVISYLLENYKIDTQEEYLAIFKVLNTQDEVVGLDRCIPREQEDDFSFESLISNNHYGAAIASLSYRQLAQHNLQKFLKKAQKVSNEKYRIEAISKILYESNIYYQKWNKTYTITALSPAVLLLKDEKGFQKYLSILQQKLTQPITQESNNQKSWKYYINQKSQEEFIQMYQLLGSSHPLIQSIPKQITDFYQKKEAEILKHGKNNYILYRNFLSQVHGNDIEHYHAYTSEPYSIYIDGKLVHEGLSNQYGCIEYRVYGAKADDVIEVETYHGKWKHAVGWTTLFEPWNTEQGMLDRLGGLGYVLYESETIDDYIRRFQQKYGLDTTQGFTQESAKKAKELFDEYIDDKWCD